MVLCSGHLDEFVSARVYKTVTFFFKIGILPKALNNNPSFRIIALVTRKCDFHLDDFLPFIIPLTMYVFGGTDDVNTLLKYWLLSMFVSSFNFSVIGLNVGHHHPEIVHEGDKLR